MKVESLTILYFHNLFIYKLNENHDIENEVDVKYRVIHINKMV